MQNVYISVQIGALMRLRLSAFPAGTPVQWGKIGATTRTHRSEHSSNRVNLPSQVVVLRTLRTIGIHSLVLNLYPSPHRMGTDPVSEVGTDAYYI